MLASSATSVRLRPTRRRPLARLMPTSSGASSCRRARRNSPRGEGVRTLSGTSVVMALILPVRPLPRRRRSWVVRRRRPGGAHRRGAQHLARRSDRRGFVRTQQDPDENHVGVLLRWLVGGGGGI